VALFRERVGMPLRILLPPGTLYSFLRKYVWRPAREVLRDAAIRDAALAAGRALGVDWPRASTSSCGTAGRFFWNATPRRSWDPTRHSPRASPRPESSGLPSLPG
jgi:hypothetical protein